jgi:hypothetical protein
MLYRIAQDLGMGRRNGAVNKVDINHLPLGVTMFKDHRVRPFMVRHRKLPAETFVTAEQAVARKNELVALERAQGVDALSYTRAIHADVTTARSLLPAGISHTDAAQFWALHHSTSVGMRVQEAIETFLTAKHARSGQASDAAATPHVQDLRTRLHQFALVFGQENLSDLTGEILSQWVLNLNQSPRSIINYRGALQNFFNYSIRRKWIVSNPIEQMFVEDLPEVGRSDKHALTVAQTNAALAVIERERPQWLVHFALRFFLGFRTAETGRFQWEWIQPEQGRVYIPASATKTKDAWSIDDVPPRFWALIKPLLHDQFGKRRTGHIYAPYPRQWDGCNGDDGRTPVVGLKAKILKELKLQSWAQNTTRDTFCTLHMSAYRSAERTALVLKHRNSQTLWQSYLGTLVPKAEAKRFFGDLSSD